MRAPLVPVVRALARYERQIAAGLVAVSVLAGLQVLRPGSLRMVDVIALARAVPAGATLTGADLRTVRIPPDALPDAAVTDVHLVLGETVAGPMGRGELLTSTRLLRNALLARTSATDVAVPVRIADPGSVALVREGDRVDLIETPSSGGPSTTVVADVTVLAVPPPSDAGLGEGALVVVAASRTVAVALASAAVSGRLSLVLRGHRP